MRIEWVCTCEERHTWRFSKEEGEEPSPAEETCPHGHPALFCKRYMPLDQCAVTFHPAAATTIDPSAKVMFEGYYYLTLMDREGALLRRSAKNYRLPDAFKLAERYLGRPMERALLLWDSSPP